MYRANGLEILLPLAKLIGVVYLASIYMCLLSTLALFL